MRTRVRIGETDRAIRDVVTADPASPPPATSKPLKDLKATRAELIAARTGELTEAEQNTAASVAALRREFDNSNVAEAAKSVFRVSKNESLNDFAKRVADPDHPLSILYDVLRYASLVLGVLSLVALLLTPLLNAAVIGADERFMDQIRDLLGRCHALSARASPALRR